MFGLGLLSEFFYKAFIKAERPVLYIRRKVAATRRIPIPKGFFDDYPRFQSPSSQTTAPLNRLNQRYRACIEWNEEIIRGKRILDIAAHDGRWSFAAIKMGAVKVVGIEARDNLVQASVNNFRQYGISDRSYRFISGDVFEWLDKIEPHSIDTVFLFGFFYHQENHMLLLSKIGRLRPKHLIIDTEISLDPNPIISLRYERTEGELNAAGVGQAARGVVISGAPSRSGLKFMLSSFGWTFDYYDWHNAGIRRWDDIVDYQESWRVTVRVSCQS